MSFWFRNYDCDPRDGAGQMHTISSPFQQGKSTTMRSRNVMHSMQFYAAAVIDLSLLMALYTAGGTNSNPMPARRLQGSVASVAANVVQLSGSYTEPAEGFKTRPVHRKMALRDRGFNARAQDEPLSENQDACPFSAVLGSVICGAILSRRAVNR
eukprot:scaffold2500_cov176-Amphora_coffeaeformis.AAC.5